MLGLTAVANHPERFARLVIMNTGLPTGDEPPGEAFLRWREFAARLGTRLPIGRVIGGGLVNSATLTPEIAAAYEAPFPDESYKAGPAAFPLLVPIRPDDPGAAEMRAARQALARWDKPALVLFSDGDPITKAARPLFRRLIPTAQDQPRIIIKDAGHFLQEEKGEEIAGHILDFIRRTPVQQ
jgi:haloalkane dehalogenase